jgi:DNA-directed RNA polymerase subunit M/transcription elongation factor TFIIS
MMTYFCEICGEILVPKINANPDDKNTCLYHCEKCNIFYNAKKESFKEHLEQVKLKIENRELKQILDKNMKINMTHIVDTRREERQ